MPEAVIVSTARSPIGRAFKGSLKDERPDDMAAAMVRAALAKLPAFETPPLAPARVKERFAPAQVDAGRTLYTMHCYRCHGAGAQSTGVLPDLRHSTALPDRALWRSIVIDGALEPRGMVGFRDWLTPEQAEQIRAYVAMKADFRQ